MSSHNLEHHKSVYLKVLLALFVFTVFTVGASYFDEIAQVCTGSAELGAIKGSTEEEQF